MSDTATTPTPEKKSGASKFIIFLVIVGLAFLGYNHFIGSKTATTAADSTKVAAAAKAKSDSVNAATAKFDSTKVVAKADTTKAATAPTGSTAATGTKSTK